MVTDPVADMLNRIRNALVARHDVVMVPASKTKIEIARLLQAQGFIKDYEVVRHGVGRGVKINLLYKERNTPAISGLKRVSKPGLRVYSGATEIPRVFGGLGVAILSTPKGIMTGREARRQRIGGEVLCLVW